MSLRSSYDLIMMFMQLVMIFVSSSNANVYSVEPDYLCPSQYPRYGVPLCEDDVDRLQLPQNLEHFEADWFMWSSLGYGLDEFAPELTQGGPPPIGAQKANLDPLTEDLITQFALQEVGHLRALKTTVGGIPRPLMDLRSKNFANLIDNAFGYELEPPFDPYCDSLHYMMAAYVVPYVGLLGYVGTNPYLCGYAAKHLLGGLLGVESGQDAIIRHYLYERAYEVVFPYNYTVAEFTVRISGLRNRLAKCGIKDEGIVVPPYLGAENRTEGNVLSADYNSLSYGRSGQEILRMVYGTGDESVPGGFYPKGANGRIAQSYLNKQ